MRLSTRLIASGKAFVRAVGCLTSVRRASILCAQARSCTAYEAREGAVVQGQDDATAKPGWPKRSRRLNRPEESKQ